jgi:hypothetical protein
MRSLNITITLILAGIMMISTNTFAQQKASPLKKEEGTVNGVKLTIEYHAPSVKGRAIWGDLVPFGKIWRAGANDATTFEFDKDVKINGKDLPAGKYSFFIIPGEVESVFVFNKVAKQWGSYSYDEAQDALRVNVASMQASTLEEELTYEITPNGFEIRWEYGKAAAKIN